MTIRLTTERIVAGIAILLTLMIMSADPRERPDGSIGTVAESRHG